MEKKHQRGARKGEAERKRTPCGFMPMPKKHDRRRDAKSRRWRDGD